MEIVMENTSSEQPAIMVPDAEINVGPKEYTEAVSPEHRDNDSKLIYVTRKRREKRPGFSWSGRDSVGALMATVACVVGVIALLLGSLGLSRSGDIFVNVTQGIIASKTDTSTTTTSEPDDRVWTFAIGDYNNRLEYIEAQSGQVKGYNVDVVSAVCRIANKNCKFEWDDYNRCWESTGDEYERQGGGIGLLGQWYDACTSWLVTHRRARTFSFTDAHSKQHFAIFMVKKGTPQDVFNWRNLTGKTIGLLRYYAEDMDCIQRQTEIDGRDRVRVLHYLSQQDLLTAVNNDEVDAVFISELLSVTSSLQMASSRLDHCSIRGESMMVRKDNTLPAWWNPALAALIASPEYQQICRGLTDESIHGNIPGPNANAVCIGY